MNFPQCNSVVDTNKAAISVGNEVLLVPDVIDILVVVIGYHCYHVFTLTFIEPFSRDSSPVQRLCVKIADTAAPQSTSITHCWLDLVHVRSPDTIMLCRTFHFLVNVFFR